MTSWVGAEGRGGQADPAVAEPLGAPGGSRVVKQGRSSGRPLLVWTPGGGLGFNRGVLQGSLVWSRREGHHMRPLAWAV